MQNPIARKLALGLVALMIGLSIPPPAHAASELEIRGLAVQSDTLVVQFEIDESFFDRLTETVGRGLSATVKYTIELWEPRRAWFDKISHSRIMAYKIKYDSWSEEYIALGPSGELDASDSLATLSVCRAGMNQRPVACLDELDPEKSYYVNLNVQLQPLTVEEVLELEKWLRGAWGRSDPTSSRSKGISKGLFDLVKNLTGFGDKAIGARSQRFSLSDLH